MFVPTIITAWLGGWWFAIFVAFVYALALRELIVLMRLSGFDPFPETTFASFIVGFIVIYFSNVVNIVLVISILLFLSVSWQMHRRGTHPIADWAIAISCGLYLGWCSGYMANIRTFNNGLWWLIIAIGTTWVADSAAYFVGKNFGKHKLSPSLSPKKTWEGYWGGVVASVLVGILIGSISPISMVHAVFASLLVGALGTLGDLVESMFKRQANAKDSGKLIPGQGGAFDRIDSLMWAGVIVSMYVTYVGG